MANNIVVALTLFSVCCLLSGVSSRPSDNEFSTSMEYLPFYGGGKGQYLEVIKDLAGNVIKEKVVSEDNINPDNIVKNSDENLLSRVLAANLQSMKVLSTNILKIHSIGRKTGRLSNAEELKFKDELASLSETASNFAKLYEEIGDDVMVLFKDAEKKRNEQFEADVGEEGVGIDGIDNVDYYPSQGGSQDNLQGSIIAEAKPIGLAVIGENGLAAARPLGTAIASSGVAIARPIGTAVAGIDPAALGITFQINHSKSAKPQ